jgi:D-alanine-D-alanine ligase
VTVLEQRDDLEARLAALRPEMAFNVAEGLHGANRESEVPELLERLGIPYTGSAPATLRTCLDKAATKEALLRADIPTPRHVVVDDAAGAASRAAVAGMRFPLIVKPLLEGSSKGIYNDSVVDSEGALRAQVERVLATYRQPALVETFLTGREFTVALLGNAPEVRALPPVEVLFEVLPDGATPIYSYEAKWIWDTPDAPLPLFACPAKVMPEEEAAITDVCRRAYIALGCRDWCRIDVRLDAGGRPHVLELNPLPGIIPDLEATSCFTKAAHAAGMSHGELVRTVLALACRRHGLAAA